MDQAFLDVTGFRQSDWIGKPFAKYIEANLLKSWIATWLCSPGLGTLRGYKAKITVDPQAQPRFCKALSVPYALQASVEEDCSTKVSLNLPNLQIGRCLLCQYSRPTRSL